MILLSFKIGSINQSKVSLIEWFWDYFQTIVSGYRGKESANITKQELSFLNYAGMGLFKILAFCFMLCPFIAIETVIRFKKKQNRLR